jgi:hypothetical protein
MLFLVGNLVCFLMSFVLRKLAQNICITIFSFFFALPVFVELSLYFLCLFKLFFISVLHVSNFLGKIDKLSFYCIFVYFFFFIG